jgi:hypothetical protein
MMTRSDRKMIRMMNITGNCNSTSNSNSNSCDQRRHGVLDAVQGDAKAGEGVICTAAAIITATVTVIVIVIVTTVTSDGMARSMLRREQEDE